MELFISLVSLFDEKPDIVLSLFAIGFLTEAGLLGAFMTIIDDDDDDDDDNDADAADDDDDEEDDIGLTSAEVILGKRKGNFRTF